MCQEKPLRGRVDSTHWPILLGSPPQASKKNRVEIKMPGDYPQTLGWSRSQPLKRSRELTIPKRSRLESPGAQDFLTLRGILSGNNLNLNFF